MVRCGQCDSGRACGCPHARRRSSPPSSLQASSNCSGNRPPPFPPPAPRLVCLVQTPSRQPCLPRTPRQQQL
eukprot:236202-Chlamydomonas_euryale.AAC.1